MGMRVLDELREAIREDATDRLRYAKTEFIATEAAVGVVDAFEAAHPGLVDETQHCHWCGSPQPRDWQVSDGRFYRDCPDCLKSRRVQP